MNLRTALASTIAVVVLASAGGISARAVSADSPAALDEAGWNSTRRLEKLEQAIAAWEAQVEKGIEPQGTNCADLRRLLETAKADIAAERAAFERSLRNPPEFENHAKKMAWIRERQAESRRISNAIRKAEALKVRLKAICG
jgi:hypothetical protein